MTALNIRTRARGGDGVSRWSLATLVICFLLLGPFVAILATASGDSQGLWTHLISTVFPRYVANTLILMGGVGVLTLLFGLSSAWVVTRYTFVGARWYEWALLLPATVPAYLIAYTYTDLLEYAGPVQGFVRDLFGWKSARDYWFPEIRSAGGAIVVMASVLYPYVYLMARTAFRLTPSAYYEVAENHHRSIFFTVALPIARPAIIAGLALVLMEVVSDFGTVEYFAVETLTLGIFNVWLGMNNLTAAAQIACVAFVFIIALLVIERTARARQRFSDSGKKGIGITPIPVSGSRAVACTGVCLLPLTLGFLVPVGVLLSFIMRGLAVTDYPALVANAANSLSMAFGAAAIVIGLALLSVLVVTYKKHPMLRALTAVSAMGYAFPGTVLAIGVVSFAGQIDEFLQRVVVDALGLQFEGFLIGSSLLLMFAYVVRFQAIGYGSIQAGVKRLSPNIMSASFVLGRSFSSSIGLIATPLLFRSMLTGGLLVFVDVMKELPMTLLLRPFNYDTLATYVYQFAKDEQLERCALAALTIVVAGLGPIILMNVTDRRIR